MTEDRDLPTEAEGPPSGFDIPAAFSAWARFQQQMSQIQSADADADTDAGDSK